MNIQLNEKEIKAALIEYVSSQGINLEHKNASVALTAGRKDNGMTAVITISAEEIEVNVIVAEEDTEEVSEPEEVKEAEPDNATTIFNQ